MCVRLEFVGNDEAEGQMLAAILERPFLVISGTLVRMAHHSWNPLANHNVLFLWQMGGATEEPFGLVRPDSH